MRYEVDYSPYYQTSNKPKKQKRAKPQKARTRAQKIGVLIIVICALFTLLALDNFTGALSPSLPTATTNNTTYYCVQTGVYADRDTANYYASLDKMKASGGYILYDGDFHVIASVYTKEHQAKSIAKRLNDGGIYASVYQFDIAPVTDTTLTQSEQANLSTASNFSHECYLELYDMSNAIDQENITSGEIATRIYSLKQFVTKQQGLVTNTYSQNAIKLSAYMGATIEILDSIGPNPTSSDIRYAYTAILAQRIS